jgi:hypothetical protein
VEALLARAFFYGFVAAKECEYLKLHDFRIPELNNLGISFISHPKLFMKHLDSCSST